MSIRVRLRHDYRVDFVVASADGPDLHSFLHIRFGGGVKCVPNQALRGDPKGLKIPRPKGRASSSPAPGTTPSLIPAPGAIGDYSLVFGQFAHLLARIRTFQGPLGSESP
jgi:hypothetical protein